MATTVAHLRAFGTRKVTIVTSDGSFEGHIVQDRLSDGAVMIMLAPMGPAGDPVVIAMAAIEEIVER